MNAPNRTPVPSRVRSNCPDQVETRAADGRLTALRLSKVRFDRQRRGTERSFDEPREANAHFVHHGLQKVVLDGK